MPRRRLQLGFTLTELMVSLAVLGIVTGYVTWLLGRQGHSYQVVDQVTEAQQSLRGLADLLDHEARVTAFLVPEEAAFCGQDNINSADVLYLTDAEALNAGTAELGARVTAGFDGSGTDLITLDSLVLDGSPFYDTDGDGAADSDFRIGGGVIIADRNDGSRGTSCGIVTRVVSPNRIDVDYVMGGQSIGVGGDLVAVPAHVYSINATNQLIRDGMILASEVEDLQFALFYDLDGDAVVTPNTETPGSADFSGGSYLSNVWDNNQLREIRYNVVVRSRMADPEWTQGRFQVRENRVAPAGGGDGFRRRVFTAAVAPRNVGQRGGI